MAGDIPGWNFLGWNFPLGISPGGGFDVWEFSGC